MCMYTSVHMYMYGATDINDCYVPAGVECRGRHLLLVCVWGYTHTCTYIYIYIYIHVWIYADTNAHATSSSPCRILCVCCACVCCVYIYIARIYADTNAHTAMHCNTLQRTLYNALQRTATHCNIHVWIYADTNTLSIYLVRINRIFCAYMYGYMQTQMHTLQHTATHTLQRTATHCNAL